MDQVSGSGAIGRPRVVVSVGTSVDGRITLRRDRLLMDEDASQVWRSLSPPGADALEEARSSLLASLYQPQAVLEGSGSFVADSVGPLSGLSIDFDYSVDVLYMLFAHAETDGMLWLRYDVIRDATHSPTA
jgi:2,5-diamino-6-(ribosylamino)-4(3H)-pyrimidinone 5'-phosphate reductase